MHEIDRQSKIFFGRNERFEDLINGALFHGQGHLNIDDFDELDSENNTAVKNTLVLRRRDLLKQCKKNGTIYAVFGAEMQSNEDKHMPVRIMTYDALFYSHLIAQDKQLVPVVTVCLYTGEEPWTKAVSLYELMNIPDELKGIVPDYRILVIDASNTDLSHYSHPEVREFFELFQDIHKLTKDEFEHKYRNKELKSVDAVKTALTLGKCKSLKDKILIRSQEGEEMCKNFDQIVEEWKAEGRIEGKIEGKIETILNMCALNTDIEFISKVTGFSVIEIKTLMSQHHISYCG